MFQKTVAPPAVVCQGWMCSEIQNGFLCFSVLQRLFKVCTLYTVQTHSVTSWNYLHILMPSVLKCLIKLKGVFLKNKRGYRLTAQNKRFWSQLILLLSVATFWICMDSTFFGISRFNNIFLIDATDRSKISSDQKRLFCAVSLYPLLFFANTPFNIL